MEVVLRPQMLLEVADRIGQRNRKQSDIRAKKVEERVAPPKGNYDSYLQTLPVHGSILRVPGTLSILFFQATYSSIPVGATSRSERNPLQ